MEAHEYIGKSFLLLDEIGEYNTGPAWKLYTVTRAKGTRDLEAIAPGDSFTLTTDAEDIADMIESGTAYEIPDELVGPIVSACRYWAAEKFQLLAMDLMKTAEPEAVERDIQESLNDAP